MQRPPAATLDQTPGLWSAASSAFALLATSDGEVAESERARFESWLHQHSDRPALRSEALAHFDQLCARLLGPDAERAHREAVAFLRACETKTQRELVLSAARAAVVADQRIDEREEIALREVCALLELDPDHG
ncbi:MAG TPA: TerB family tellurite resistance protein [Polyangia bacterium]|nr:TerB family tellurite resistance protein [Polyangia bacterium]